MADKDPGMKALRDRDLRNSASPIPVPNVQAVDRQAADDEDRDAGGFESAPDAPEGSADFAESATNEVESQREVIADSAGSEVEPEQVNDEVEPEQVNDEVEPEQVDDEDEQTNVFGNVAPDHAPEEEADRDANADQASVPSMAAGGHPIEDDEDV